MSDSIPTTPEEFPINEDLSQYEVPYFPEEFTEEEQYLLKPFFTNLDQPVFVMQNLPSEIVGALCSRYSRAEGGIRSVFLAEYIDPIVNPENQRDWENLSTEQRSESWTMRGEFFAYLDFLHEHGGLDKVVNLQRARNFYTRWLSQFGDDSIAEMGTSVSLCIEGISNIAVNAIQRQRIGVSSLEKSSRYVFFGDKSPDGNYKFVVPGEIRGSDLEAEYREVMTLLFDTYVDLLPLHLAHIKELYPKGEDETNGSFERSRKAKVFDDLRELLPFSTQTSLGLNVSGRAAELLVNRLLSDTNGEVRWWGQKIAAELQKVIPSFIERPTGKRGAEQQIYRNQLNALSHQMADSLGFEGIYEIPGPSAMLITHTPDPEIEILARYLYEGSQGTSLEKIREKLFTLSYEERNDLLGNILDRRNLGEMETKRENVRFRKPHRAFEAAQFTFDILCRGGDYRDLHRHRMLTQGRQRLTTEWGYDLEPEITEGPYIDRISYVLDRVAELNRELAKVAPDTSQYSVPFAFLQRFYWTVSARELYWVSELRTGPQGRPHYREIVQQMATQALFSAPAVFQDMRTDYNHYGLSRRESEIKAGRKMGES